MGADEADKGAVVLRFRGSSGDGRIAASEELRLAKAVPPPPRLGTPSFGHQLYRPGDAATVSLRAESVQRGNVHLVIEKEVGGAWQAVAELDTPIEAGQAWGTWTIPPEEQFAPVRYRARAVASFGEGTSDPCTVQSSGHCELADPQWSGAHPSRARTSTTATRQ